MAPRGNYLVVGAGATGLAFTDALTAHKSATVTLVDRRDGVGGHWRTAYPFVQLHQASSFYGVASTLLGDGSLQADGPEAGLHHRATGAEVLSYFEAPVLRRLTESGRVELRPATAYVETPDGGQLDNLTTGTRTPVPPLTRIVNAHYLAPVTPADAPPPFQVDTDASVVPVAMLPEVSESRFVVVGSGKTATDAVVWLLGAGVDPDAITWVRPREPWMLDRAAIQPDPATFLGFAATVMECAADASSLDALFLQLEESGVMLRIDPAVAPTMAKAPTLGRWELDLLRQVTRVVRLGHVRRAGAHRLELEDGTVALEPGTVVIHCAADGLPRRPVTPVWGEHITMQPVRAGFPCYGAALIGFVEASGRPEQLKNTLCAPSNYGNTLQQRAEMMVRGTRSSLTFGAEPDIRAWSDTVALNPARIPPGTALTPAIEDARARLRHAGPAGLRRLTALAGLTA